MDHAPGPIIAKVAPNAANSKHVNGSPAPAKAIHPSHTAISTPVTGVHKPSRIKIPSKAPRTCGAICVEEGVLWNKTRGC